MHMGIEKWYTLIVQITDDESVSMQLLLGYIGLLNAVVLAPVLPILVSH
jgi:hypothetical protein